MKKIWLFIFVLLSFCIISTVKAEEVVEEVEPVEEVKEEVKEVEPDVVETEEPTFEDFKAEITAFLNQYLEDSWVEKIIEWAVDGGLLIALFGVYLKYNRYKAKTCEEVIGEVKAQVGDHLKENFDKLSGEQIKEIFKKIDFLEEQLETVMKVLVLTQDNTEKGKIALIDFLGKHTSSDEINKVVEEVKKELQEDIKVKEEAVSKVNGKYDDIF